MGEQGVRTTMFTYDKDLLVCEPPAGVQVACRWQRADYPQDGEGKDAPVLIGDWNKDSLKLYQELAEEAGMIEGVDWHAAYPQTTLVDDKNHAVETYPQYWFWTPKYNYLCSELWSAEKVEANPEAYAGEVIEHVEQGCAPPSHLLISEDDFEEYTGKNYRRWCDAAAHGGADGGI